MGVPISPAERLKIYTSPRAELCKRLYQEYRETYSKYFPDQRASLLRNIVQLAALVHEDGDRFDAGPAQVKEFLENTEDLDADFQERVTRACGTIARLIDVRHNAFERIEGQAIKPMVLVYFGLYIALCRRRRTDNDFASDLIEFRQHLKERVKIANVARSTFKDAKEWIDTKLEQLGAVPVNMRPVMPAESSRRRLYEAVDVENERGARKRARDDSGNAVLVRSSPANGGIRQSQLHDTDSSTRIFIRQESRNVTIRRRVTRVPVVKNETSQ